MSKLIKLQAVICQTDITVIIKLGAVMAVTDMVFGGKQS